MRPPGPAPARLAPTDRRSAPRPMPAVSRAARRARGLRIPGLARTNAIEKYLASRKLSVFSTDVTGDDWRRIREAITSTNASDRAKRS